MAALLSLPCPTLPCPALPTLSCGLAVPWPALHTLACGCLSCGLALETVLFNMSSSSSSSVTDTALLEPFHYLRAHPGKNIRSQLIEAFNHWLQVPAEKLAIIKDAVEMLHTASLL